MDDLPQNLQALLAAASSARDGGNSQRCAALPAQLDPRMLQGLDPAILTSLLQAHSSAQQLLPPVHTTTPSETSDSSLWSQLLAACGSSDGQGQRTPSEPALPQMVGGHASLGGYSSTADQARSASVQKQVRHATPPQPQQPAALDLPAQLLQALQSQAPQVPGFTAQRDTVANPLAALAPMLFQQQQTMDAQQQAVQFLAQALVQALQKQPQPSAPTFGGAPQSAGMIAVATQLQQLLSGLQGGNAMPAVQQPTQLLPQLPNAVPPPAPQPQQLSAGRSWTEHDQRLLLDLVSRVQPQTPKDWEYIATSLGRWVTDNGSIGGQSAAMMQLPSMVPAMPPAMGVAAGHDTAGTPIKPVRRTNPRAAVPMYVKAVYALMQLPGNEGNLTQISDIVAKHPEFSKELDRTPRPGAKTYPRWKDALLSCFKEGRYPYLEKTNRKNGGSTVYRLDTSAVRAEDLQKYLCLLDVPAEKLNISPGAHNLCERTPLGQEVPSSGYEPMEP